MLYAPCGRAVGLAKASLTVGDPFFEKVFRIILAVFVKMVFMSSL